MRWLKALLVSLALLLGAALVPMRRVQDDSMRPNLQRGDLVWVLPVQPLRGDVVAVADPLDPAHTVLRRTIVDGGGKIAWDDGGLRVSGKRMRQSDMGMADGDRVFEELLWSKPPARAWKWRVLLRKPPTTWLSGQVEVPDAHWYLLADDRDRATDSRWWGPVPATAVRGVVRLRVGRPDAWRGWVQWLKGWE